MNKLFDNKPRRLAVAAVSIVILMVVGLRGLSARQRLGKPAVRLIHHDASLKGAVWLPPAVGAYHGTAKPLTPVEIRSLPADTSFGRMAYQGPDGFVVEVTVVVMGTDRTSIHKPEFCLTSQGWQISRARQVQIPLAGGGQLPVELLDASLRLRRDGDVLARDGLYAYWFVADGELTASHGRRMWSLAKNLLSRGVLQRWAYISCFAHAPPPARGQIGPHLRPFIAALAPQLHPDLP